MARTESLTETEIVTLINERNNALAYAAMYRKILAETHPETYNTVQLTLATLRVIDEVTIPHDQSIPFPTL